MRTVSVPEASVSFRVAGEKGEEIEAALSAVLEQALHALTAGQRISITADEETLTTTQAAHRLHISRPTLMRLIHRGIIPAHKVGSHYRILASDISAYRTERRHERVRRQLTALTALRELEDRENISLEA